MCGFRCPEVGPHRMGHAVCCELGQLGVHVNAAPTDPRAAPPRVQAVLHSREAQWAAPNQWKGGNTVCG